MSVARATRPSTPARIPAALPAGYGPSGAQSTPVHDREPARRPVANASDVPCEVIDKLVVHIAGEDERASIEDLSSRTGSNTPTGALMVGAVDGTPLAVV